MSPIHGKKISQKTRTRGNFLNFIKNILQNFIANITFNAEKLEYFPQGSGTR